MSFENDELTRSFQQRWANDKSWPTTMSWRWVVTIFESERWSKKKTVGKFFEKKQKRFFSRQKNFTHLFSSSSRKRFFSLERLFLMSKFLTSRASFSWVISGNTNTHHLSRILKTYMFVGIECTLQVYYQYHHWPAQWSNSNAPNRMGSTANI